VFQGKRTYSDEELKYHDVPSCKCIPF
jgi:hypothetical protein